MMLNKLKEGLAGQSLQKAQDVIREFNDTVPKIRAVGAILDALRTAALLQEQLQSVGFKGVTTDVKPGLLPSVEISLLN